MNNIDEQFLCLHEFYLAARNRLPPPLWDYLTGGAESETTLLRNRQALDSLALRPRVLNDVRELDTSARLMGHSTTIPVMLAPIGGLQDFDPAGSAMSARAGSEFGVFTMHSSVAEPAMDVVAGAGNGPKIYQLYVRGDDQWLDERVTQVVNLGFDAFCFTVDLAVYSRRERDLAKRYVTTTRQLDTHVGEAAQAGLSWDQVKRVKEKFDIPIVLKGIGTPEDAALACEHGIDVVYLSNHGGRQLDHGLGTMAILPSVVDAVAGRAEIVVDGGFLRGTDVVKAMCLGASMVGIGKLFGLAAAAAGQAGVVRMLGLLETEIRIALGLMGAASLSDLNSSFVTTTQPVRAPGFGSAFPLLEAELTGESR